MTKRYVVVPAYKGRVSRPGTAGRFRRLPQALKERDRQNASSFARVETHADLLSGGSFDYRWRVWDAWHRRFAD